jgi:hypothetical protein
MVRLGLFLVSALLLLTGSTVLYVSEPEALPLVTASPSLRATLRPVPSEVAQSPTPTPTRSQGPLQSLTEPVASVAESPVPSSVPSVLPSVVLPTLVPTPSPTPCIELLPVTICLDTP